MQAAPGLCIRRECCTSKVLAAQKAEATAGIARLDRPDPCAISGPCEYETGARSANARCPAVRCGRSTRAGSVGGTAAARSGRAPFGVAAVACPARSRNTKRARKDGSREAGDGRADAAKAAPKGTAPDHSEAARPLRKPLSIPAAAQVTADLARAARRSSSTLGLPSRRLPPHSR